MLVQLREYDEAKLGRIKPLKYSQAGAIFWRAGAQACARLGDRRDAMACSDLSMAAPGSSPWRWEARRDAAGL
ncbi:MAG: hypothetical protein R3C45_08965 [Phycisphaerales bacterium]